MDKHLVYLVKQTEKYGEKLAKGMTERGDGGRTIEDVLCEGEVESRRRKVGRVDYKRMVIEGPQEVSIGRGAKQRADNISV